MSFSALETCRTLKLFVVWYLVAGLCQEGNVKKKPLGGSVWGKQGHAESMAGDKHLLSLLTHESVGATYLCHM